MNGFFEEINGVFTPTGCEDKMRNFIENQALRLADKISTDNMGNLIVRKAGNGKRFLLSAEIDELSLVSAYADDEGRIFFHPLGITGDFAGATVVFDNGTVGVVCRKNNKIYIDIGADNRQTANEKCPAGSFAVLKRECDALCSGRYAVASARSRIPVYILLSVLRRIITAKYDLYLAFCVQGNTGHKGAYTAAYNIEPDIALSVACCADDARVGEGVCIKVADKGLLASRPVVDALTSAAILKEIPYNHEVSSELSQAGSLYNAKSGAQTAGLDIPLCECGCGKSIFCSEDINAAINLILAYLDAA